MLHTILDAALKVVDDSSEDSRQVHHMSTLSKTQNKQLIPAGTHQSGVCLLTERQSEMTMYLIIPVVFNRQGLAALLHSKNPFSDMECTTLFDKHDLPKS